MPSSDNQQDESKSASNPGRYCRFEDSAVQESLIREIEGANLEHSVKDDGTVVFWSSEQDAIMEIICRIRDSLFPWYLQKWQSEPDTERYRQILIAHRLPFFVEHHETGTWFLVRRQDRNILDAF